MAVTQISRIQVRRGKKLSPTGIPQLAGGEIAWAVDSQELFIGNGSVAEGAPYVGNTKILTEHDNILSLISSYRFAAEDPSIPFSVSRSLQSKLDEYVSVLDFGAVGDGITDNVSAFNTAFTQLFQNGNTAYRRVLKIPNGIYVFNNDLTVPSDVIIEGDTNEYTILKFNNGIMKFVSTNIEDPEQFTIENRPTNIKISNLTIDQGRLRITGASNVTFELVCFNGTYTLTDPNETPQDQTSTIFWINDNSEVLTTDITFTSCLFTNHEIAVRCDQSVADETIVTFDKCDFRTSDTGIMILGIPDQINNWRIMRTNFSDIANHGFYSSAGSNTLIRDCYFRNCGVNLNGTPSVPSIYFAEFKDNQVLDCHTDRQQEYGITSNENARYIAEVSGAEKVSFYGRNYTAVSVTDSFLPLAIFSAHSKYIFIEYTLRLKDLNIERDVRLGTLTLTVNQDDNTVNITDSYTFNSQPGQAMGYISSNLMVILDVAFGRLYRGAVVAGNNITPGTRIVSIDPTVNPTTQIGEYTVDRVPSVSPTSSPPLYQEIQFERNTMALFEFSAEYLEGESVNSNTIMLRYRNPINSGLAGDFSFNVTYGV